MKLLRTPCLSLTLLGLSLAAPALGQEERSPARPMPVGPSRGGGISSPSEGGSRNTALPMGPRLRHPDPGSGAEGRTGTPAGVGRRLTNANGGPVFAPVRYTSVCRAFPDRAYWQHRDLMAEIQWMSRRGYIPVSEIPAEATELTGVSDFPAGWKAYGLAVPPGGKLHVRLHHVNEGWFRILMVNRWGGLEQGMLQNLIPTGNPEASYTNLGKEIRAVYVIVDDPGWMSSKAYPYFLDIERNWDAKKLNPKAAPVLDGIWASDTNGVSAEFAHPTHRAGFAYNPW